MTRTVLGPLAGVFLLVYGIGSIIMSWWAYSVTSSAFTSVRTFTAAFDRERADAAAAVQRAGGLLGRRDGASSGTPGAGSGGGPAIARGPDELRDRLRGILGGGGASATATPAATAAPATSAAPGSASQSSDGPALLGDLGGLIGQLGDGWSRLGEGPLPTATLDRVELAINAVLVWMVVHGVASVIVGIALLRPRPRPAPVPVSYAGASHGVPRSYTADDSPTLELEGLSRHPYRRDE